MFVSLDLNEKSWFSFGHYLRKSPVLLGEGNDNGPLHGLQTETLFTFYLKLVKLVTQIENVK